MEIEVELEIEETDSDEDEIIEIEEEEEEDEVFNFAVVEDKPIFPGCEMFLKMNDTCVFSRVS